MSILLPGDQPPDSSGNYPIYARSGWLIPQPEEFIPAMSLEGMRIRAREWLDWRQNLTIRSVSPHPYNCVGMIFASRRAIIEIDHIYDILREDGYRQIQLGDIMVGDIALYKNGYDEPSHIGLITEIGRIGQTQSVRVISKWGLDPEFEHFMENVPPRLGNPVEFYTERLL